MGFLASAAPFLSLAGTAVDAFGAIQQGQAQAASLQYQAEVAHNNAIIAAQYAAAATKAGEANAYTQGLKNRQKAGAIVAGLAASNLDVNTGSAARVRAGEQETAYADTETIRQEAALKSYGYKVEGSNFTAQSGIDTAEAGQASQAGFLKAGGLLFSGLSTVSPKFKSLFDSANIGSAAASGFSTGAADYAATAPIDIGFAP